MSGATVAVVIATVPSAVELRAMLDAERRTGRTVGFVPTMGALHAGHASLVRAASAADVVVVSVFVNPLQFAPSEDLAAYPRSLDADVAVAEDSGASIVFAPDEQEMYPGGRDSVLTTVAVPALAATMEGASRPTHFAGVCTVVAKLLNVVGPCTAYFGEKDFQQLAVIRRMVADLSFPVEVIGCPTLREPDGLALSSRNVYLSAEERAVAPVLQRALRAGAEAVAGGQRGADEVRSLMASIIEAAPLGALDYLEVADPTSLEALSVLTGPCRLLGAVRFGRTRLIDNVAAVPGGVR